MDSPSGSGSKDLSPILYGSEKSKPFVAKYYDAEGTWDKLPSVIQESGDTVQDYFELQNKNGKYENDEVGFKEFIKNLERVTDTKHSPLQMKLGKIAEFIKYMKRASKYGATE